MLYRRICLPAKARIVLNGDVIRTERMNIVQVRIKNEHSENETRFLRTSTFIAILIPPYSVALLPPVVFQRAFLSVQCRPGTDWKDSTVLTMAKVI